MEESYKQYLDTKEKFNPKSDIALTDMCRKYRIPYTSMRKRLSSARDPIRKIVFLVGPQMYLNEATFKKYIEERPFLKRASGGYLKVYFDDKQLLSQFKLYCISKDISPDKLVNDFIKDVLKKYKL
jgi:hypothetical protein